jgi:type IV secretory pathway VirB10-like protein
VAEPFAPPPLPPVRRLTRMVWIAGAFLICGTIFLIVFLAAPRQAPSPPPTPPPAPSDPSFLQRPAGEAAPSAETLAEREALRGFLSAPQGGQGANASPTAMNGTTPTNPVNAAPIPPSPRQAERDARRESYLRALSAPLLHTNPPAPERDETSWTRLLGALSQAPPASDSSRPEAPSSRALPLNPAASAIASAGGRPTQTAATPGLLTTTPTVARSFLQKGTVAAGTVIPALLLTAVDSGLPGQLIAQVSRNVYDARQQTLLIPQASRLLGRYEDQVSLAQSRLLVAWNRLVLPSGEEIALGGWTGTDPSGAAGLPAQVDRHVLRIVGNALLLSVLSAGAQLSQPQSTGFAAGPSAGNVAAGALGQELTAAGLQMLERNSGTLPTLKLPAGTPLLVFVQNDLQLPEAWAEGHHDPR